jgi:hypothetical protein
MTHVHAEAVKNTKNAVYLQVFWQQEKAVVPDLDYCNH